MYNWKHQVGYRAKRTKVFHFKHPTILASNNMSVSDHGK